MSSLLESLNLAQFENNIAEGCQVMDMRPSFLFCEGHVPGSLYVSQGFLGNSLLKALISSQHPLMLVTVEGEEDACADQLRKAGFDNFAGYLQGSFNTWFEAKNPIDVVISVDAEEIMMDIKFGNPDIVDLRSKAAYDQLHLETADHLPMKRLLEHTEELPKDILYYLYDEDGEKALTVISWLKRFKYNNFYHIRGGLKSLNESEAIMTSNNKPPESPLNKPELLN